MKKPIKLLFIEDDELDRRAFLRMVRDKGLDYELTHAETVAAARARLAESRFDIIVADYHLPDGDCTDLFDEVKDIPFVLLTGTLEEELALRTLERGADDYLPKDVEHRHLEAVPFTVEKTLHRKHLRETEQRLTRQLHESEERLAAFMRHLPGAAWIKDRDGRYVYANAEAERIFGTSLDQLRGKTDEEVFPPEIARQFRENDCRVLDEGGSLQTTETLRQPDGVEHHSIVRKFTLAGPGGQAPSVAGVAFDITDRIRAEAELKAAKVCAEQAKTAAEQANRAKDHFLAVLSHELRTPLTPVVMAVSMLQDRTDLEPKVREMLEIVRCNVELEARLIDDLLDVSRIARGKIELSRNAVPLCMVIQRAVEVCKPDIEARRLHFGVDLGPAAPYWVEVDVPRLQQVFWNLLKNAIKFTPHGGCVGIRCRLNEKYVVAEVNDSGMGIEPESLPRVFNAFEQVEQSITRQFGGLGLGLAISKALVEMHGGQIEAHSEGRDKGATFRVRLPLAAPAGQSKMPTPAASPGRVAHSLHILLVEDHGITAKMMEMLLTANGHTVKMAGDIATALELAGQHAFDLLLSDLGLPDGSGHDLMRQLRDRGHKFPGIALSGYGREGDIQRSYQAGFAAHLTKPASREAVVETIAFVTAGERTTLRDKSTTDPPTGCAGADGTAGQASSGTQGNQIASAGPRGPVN